MLLRCCNCWKWDTVGESQSKKLGGRRFIPRPDRRQRRKPEHISCNLITEKTDLSLPQCARFHPTGTAVDAELMKYSSYPTLSANADPCTFWRDLEKAGCPKLAGLAREHLCIMPSSAPVERVFSKSGWFVCKRRCKMSGGIRFFVDLFGTQQTPPYTKR